MLYSSLHLIIVTLLQYTVLLFSTCILALAVPLFGTVMLFYLFSPVQAFPIIWYHCTAVGKSLCVLLCLCSVLLCYFIDLSPVHAFPNIWYHCTAVVELLCILL